MSFPIPSINKVPYAVYCGSVINTVSATTNAFNCNFHYPAPDRLIAAFFTSRSSTARALSNGIIGGVAANEIFEAIVSTRNVCLMQALVPTTTGGVINVDSQSGGDNLAVHVFALYGLDSITPVSTNNAGTTLTVGGPPSDSNSIAIMAAVASSSAGWVPPATYTEVFDGIIETAAWTLAAMRQAVPKSTNNSVTITQEAGAASAAVIGQAIWR